MQVKLESVPVSFWMTGALIYLGSMFQVGYFSSLGIEFLSTISVADWALSLMLISGPVIGSAFTIMWVARFLAQVIHKTLSSRALKWAMVTFPNWLIVVIVAYAAFYMSVNFSGFNFWYKITFVLFMLGWTALLLSEMQERWEPDFNTYVFLVIGWGMCAIYIGFNYGTLGGRVCNMIFKDGRPVTSVYMRSVSDGHLIRMNGTTLFVSKGEVVEINCPWDGNTLDARAKILKGKLSE